jgi:hypothetical protein
MNVKELLDHLQVEYKEEGHARCRAGWLQLDCPYCSRTESRWHLGFNLNRGYLHCWSCGPKPIVATLAEITGAKVGDVLRLTKDLEGVRQKIVKPKGKYLPPPGVAPMTNPHKRYLTKRGFDWNLLTKKWGLQGIGGLSTHPWRLFIPILYNGDAVSWSTRRIKGGDHYDRYRSASLEREALPHKDLLYGEDHCTHSIVAVEGFTDAWAIGYGAVATMGTSYTRTQILRMSRYPRVAICFDSDKAGRQRARELAGMLSSLGTPVALIHLDAKDAGEADRSEIRAIRRAFLED